MSRDGIDERENNGVDDACPFPPGVGLPKESKLASKPQIPLDSTHALRARILGLLIGGFLIASVFVLPFGYRGARPMTLYDIFQQNMFLIRESPGYVTPATYMLTIDFVLLIIAGFLGASPRLSALISVIVISSFVLVTLLYFGQDMGYGIGYYVIWMLSLAAFGNALWRNSRKQTEVTQRG